VWVLVVLTGFLRRGIKLLGCDRPLKDDGLSYKKIL